MFIGFVIGLVLGLIAGVIYGKQLKNVAQHPAADVAKIEADVKAV